MRTLDLLPHKYRSTYSLKKTSPLAFSTISVWLRQSYGLLPWLLISSLCVRISSPWIYIKICFFRSYQLRSVQRSVINGAFSLMYTCATVRTLRTGLLQRHKLLSGTDAGRMKRLLSLCAKYWMIRDFDEWGCKLRWMGQNRWILLKCFLTISWKFIWLNL